MSNYDNMVNGLFLDVAIGVDPTVPAVLDCETSFTFQLNTAMNDSTCKGNKDAEGRPFKTFEPGKHTGELSVNGVIELGGSGNDIFDLVDNLKAGDVIDYQVRNTTTGSPVAYITGKSLTQSVDLQTPDNGIATFSATFGNIDDITIAGV